MTDIRELLREATDDLVVDHGDPVGLVSRATTGRRRTLAAIGCVVIAVIVAITVPLLASGRTRSAITVAPSPTPAAHTHTVIQMWGPGDGEVAAGFGSIWGAQCCGGSTAPSWVDKLNPVTGELVAHIHVPGPTSAIAAGAGRVWTIGATEGGPSAISVIDPVTLHVTTLRLSNPQAEPDDIAFAQGSAWVTLDVLNQVWRLTPTPAGVHKSVLPVPGAPYDITATGNGTLWVGRAVDGKNNLTRIVATQGSAHLGGSVRWAGDIYSPAGSTTLWASLGAHNALQLAPALLKMCSACAQSDSIIVRGNQIYTELSTARGLFVSTFGGPMSIGHTAFYSNAALADSQETPTARVLGGGPLAPDGNGVVIGAGQAGLIHWIPGH